MHEIYGFHRQYGERVRVAPNEISFATGDAWQEIHGLRSNGRAMLKNPIWWGELPGRTPSIVSALDLAAHERMRKLLSHCFSVKALNGQEETVQQYVSMMIQKFRERAGDARKTTVNIVDWYMYLTFDILGDLGFGESFKCLEASTYHPWVQTIFNYFKTAAYVGILRIYLTTSIDKVLMRCIPKSVKQVSQHHYSWAVNKVHQRMNLDTQREDFMTHILKNNNEKGMTVPEIENNTNVLIVAGSETCGTVLSGTTNYLVKSPEAYRRLTQEIRTTFSKEEDMTFAALQEMPYLNAVIAEGLRLCPPSSSGLSHVVPPGGDTVCGEWLPEGVGSHLSLL